MMRLEQFVGIFMMVTFGETTLGTSDGFNMTSAIDREDTMQQPPTTGLWKDTEHGKVLSRRKRFIVFPEGSSFSVAVCMTIGLYGNPNYQFVSWALNWGIAYNLPNQTVSFQKEMSEPKPMVQRRFRRDLYQKLEVIMDSMGYDGRDCILRALCESSQYFGGKGRNMMAEMLRTLFSYPKQKVLSFEHADHRLYDEAHRKVYDQTIPMIGVERLFTIGITVALAYELPSITINQIEQMLQENAADGYIFPKVDKNANDTILIDSKHSQSSVTPARKNIFSYYYQTPRPGQVGGTGGMANRINYYTAPDRRYDKFDRYGQRLPQWNQYLSNRFPRPPYADPTRNDFGSIVNRYLQGWIRRHPPNYPMGKKRFYPVFGKRSIREDTDPLDRHFLNHHRVTRHALYERIEQFLTAKGKHGHHCVLRALCESGQRNNDSEPDTFLKEILRAIFSLPSTHESPAHHKHRIYDEAHAHTGNCTETYSYCEDSFWSSDFMF
uniref:Uncharacterized protein n=1 Tax=Anopheles minimus TaxID=112268 RepID=A0A182VYI4_9DIPT